MKECWSRARAARPVRSRPHSAGPPSRTLHLVSRRDRVVAKSELLEEVWGDRFVSESALSRRKNGSAAGWLTVCSGSSLASATATINASYARHCDDDVGVDEASGFWALREPTAVLRARAVPGVASLGDSGRTIGDAELAEDVRHVVSNRLATQPQPIGDCCIGEPTRKQIEHLGLAVRDAVESAGRCARGEGGQHTPTDSAAEHRLAGNHRLDRTDDLLRGRFLEEVPARLRRSRNAGCRRRRAW